MRIWIFLVIEMDSNMISNNIWIFNDLKLIEFSDVHFFSS